MGKQRQFRMRDALAGLAVLVTALGINSTAGAAEGAKDIMLKACDSYADAKSGHIRALISVDQFVAADRMIQRNAVVDIYAKRPNKFKSVAQGDSQATVYFDGKMLTSVDAKTGFYGQYEIKDGDLKQLLDETEKINQPTDALEFISQEFCQKAVAKISSDQKLEPLMLDGDAVEHLAFVNADEDINWEAWIKKVGNRYVIKKVVISTANLKQQPRYEFLLISETLNEEIADQEFVPVMGSSSHKISFLSEIANSNEPPRYGTARRVARRTTRRVIYRNASHRYYNQLPYYLTASGTCAFDGTEYDCAGVKYRPALEGGVTVYVRR